jgi:N utilization substance protein A
VERGIIRQRQTEKSAEEERERIARADVPPEAFEILLQEFNVSDRVYAVISEAGFLTVGDLLLQMRLEPDSILGLNGMGPKAMSELEEALNSKFPPTPEAVEIVEGEAGEAVLEMPAAEAVTEPEAALEEAVTPVEMEPGAEAQPIGTEAEPVMAQPAETGEMAEAAGEAAAVEGTEVSEAPAQAGEVLPGVDEEGVSLEELFTLRPEVLDFGTVTEEEEEDEVGKKKAKGKKKKFVEVEYDPDKDVLLAKKKRKRSTGDWEESW